MAIIADNRNRLRSRASQDSGQQIRVVEETFIILKYAPTSPKTPSALPGDLMQLSLVEIK